jgi:ABC-type transport system involved in cytochrome bd biosynthesis fused ATPase/permease subunit
VSVEIENASFSWGFRVNENQADAKRGGVAVQEAKEAVISEMNFKLKHDDLLVVVGMVGCGKSTLLASIMEETKIVTGKRTIKGTLAYVEQEPFIYSASIKDNICLGKAYEEGLFNKALEAS